ncbi:hypothetical protein ABW20_dc0100853 [Dactylellina cionopaga]|nr:hypothetical protein ABW20_dc0100853 [Dactylellina cionopaga]
MHLRFLHPDTSEIYLELKNFPFSYDTGFKYHPGQSPRFDIQAVRDHCDLILNHFLKALENVEKRAPLTYERAWYTNHDDPLLLEAAERSERRLLAHVVRYTEAKYGVHMQMQQKQLDHFLRNGCNNADLKRANGLIPLPFVDLAILQYCHMLSPNSYLDDISRNINHAYGEIRFEDPAPLSDIPFPLRRMLERYNDPLKPQDLNLKDPDGPYKPRHLDFQNLNGKNSEPEYLRWPEGEPLTADHTRLLDEIAERMMCARCDRDIYFTKDIGEAWFSFLEGESVLCRYCGCFNSLSTLKWMYLRDDMVALYKAIEHFRNPGEESGPRYFPDTPGRHSLGSHHGKYAIDRVLRHSVSDEGWGKMLEVLNGSIGSEDDWEELLTQVRLIDRDLPSTNLYPGVVEVDCSTFWEDYIGLYRKSLNNVTTVDFSASIANLRDFAKDITRLYDLSLEGDTEPKSNTTKSIPRSLRKLKCGKLTGQEGGQIPIPKGSGEKYEQFMKLKAKYPKKDLLPTTAIELFWRTHILYPPHYHRWCLQNLNCWIPHAFDKLQDKSFDCMVKRYEETAELWWKEYSEEYVSDPGDWTRYFSMGDDHTKGRIVGTHRPGLITAEQKRARPLYKAHNHTSLPDDELTTTEQEELFHTLFPTNQTRFLVTTKLVLQTYLAKTKSKNTLLNPKLSPLDTYLDKHWEETHVPYLSVISKFPSLTQKFNLQILAIVHAIDLLFSYISEPPTNINQIFQQNEPSADHTFNVLHKRLLMWLCFRHSPFFKPNDTNNSSSKPGGSRVLLLPSLIKQLHLKNIMRYRVEISPADLFSARVVSFVETHYAGIVERVVRSCDSLIGGVIRDTINGRAMIEDEEVRVRDAGLGRGFRDKLVEERKRASLASSRYSHTAGGRRISMQSMGSWGTR